MYAEYKVNRETNCITRASMAIARLLLTKRHEKLLL